jgi:hypothetical protein
MTGGARCIDCGELLDVWNTCPQVSPEVAATGSSMNTPLYCGQSPVVTAPSAEPEHVSQQAE